MPCTIARKNIKYLGVNLTKYAEDWYTEKYKLVLREMEGDKRKCKHIIDIDKKTEYYE